MILAYKEHIQFILLLVIMYVTGVWGGMIIYIMFPVVMLLLGIKKRYFELLICTLWLLILSDYVPVKDATYDDLQFAKDLKFLLPPILFIFYLRDKTSFPPIPRFFLYFVPFFIIVLFSLNFAIYPLIGLQKTIAFILMYFTIPLYIIKLHNDNKEYFWKALLTFIIGMLTIGVVLGAVAPQIGLMEDGRFKGVFGNPNGIGIFLALTFVFWYIIEHFKLAIFTQKEKWYILTILIVSLFWSGSRNSLMTIILFLLLSRFVKTNWFLAVLALFSFIIFREQIFEAFINLVEFFNLESYFRLNTLEAGSGRKIAWEFAYSQIKETNFFIGGGFGHDEHVMRPNYSWLALLGHNGGVHNSYLSMWFDSGLIGLIAYFGGLLIFTLKKMNKSFVVLATILAILFNINYESWLVGSLNPFTILFLFILTIFTMHFNSKVPNNLHLTDENQ